MVADTEVEGTSLLSKDVVGCHPFNELPRNCADAFQDGVAPLQSDTRVSITCQVNSIDNLDFFAIFEDTPAES